MISTLPIPRRAEKIAPYIYYNPKSLKLHISLTEALEGAGLPPTALNLLGAARFILKDSIRIHFPEGATELHQNHKTNGAHA